MSALARRTRVVVALAALVAALAAWQGAAAAALTVASATLDTTSNGDTGPVTSVSTPAGGVLGAEVKATDTSSWRGTRYDLKSDPPGTATGTCIDHDNGRKSADFNVTAPAGPGKYDAEFQAFTNDDCDQGGSNTKVLDKAIEVTAPTANPNLAPVCGINVILILDESGSIGQTQGATKAVRSAAKAFLDALKGTGSKVALIAFSTSAKEEIPYTTVDSTSIASTFNPYIDNTRPGGGYNPNGWTNWEDAFKVAKETNAKGPVANMVVFITDGDPTARNGDKGPVDDLVEGEALALTKAQTESDRVKAQRSHVFAIGVGSAVTKPTSERRLTAVSGTQEYPAAGFEQADYTLVEDFDDLEQALRDLAIELCQASVTITKQVDPEGDGTYVTAGLGWKFTATVATNPGDYTWVKPPPATPPGPPDERTATTNADGVASFQWKPKNANASSTVTLDEDVPEGWQLVEPTICQKSAPGVTRKRTTRTFGAGTTWTGTLKPGEYATCTVKNRKPPAPPPTGKIKIIKEAVPESDRVFKFSGTAPIGNFSLTDGGDLPDQVEFEGLAPGTYVVSETQQNPNIRIAPSEKWTLADIVCSKGAEYVVDGAQVSIQLAGNEYVSCTFQNKRGDEPPPEPPDPPAPPPPPPPAPPLPPPLPVPDVIDPPRTVLEVEKTAPATARVGQRVAFSLTVTNVGTVPAGNVLLRDLPPGAIGLGGMRSSSRARTSGGKVTWIIGTLAPGASRTIAGTVRIVSGTPGKKHNTVLASANNADTVSAYADTSLRVLAQRRIIPPVTG
jgi:uncharacterized repeat protein (TIGR01451 family)